MVRFPPSFSLVAATGCRTAQRAIIKTVASVAVRKEMRMFHLRMVVVMAFLTALGCTRGWQLPIHLGDSTDHVRKALGPPKEVIDFDAERQKAGPAAQRYLPPPGQTLEYYPSWGLSGRYANGRLFGVTVRCRPAPGWLLYEKPIVEGILVTDTRLQLLQKLGKPTKTEGEGDQTRYYWRRDDYTVDISFEKQSESQNASEYPTAILLYR